MIDMTESEIETVHEDDYMEKMKDICMDLYSKDDIKQSIEQDKLDIDIAKRMLDLNMDTTLISKITNLSIEEIGKLA